MKKGKSLVSLLVFFFVASPVFAAELPEFASATLAFYLLLNIAIGSMLFFAVVVFVDLWRQRKLRRRRSEMHFVERRKQGSRSSGYSPVGARTPRVDAWLGKERRIS